MSRPRIASLAVGAGLGVGLATGVTWLLVAVQAATASIIASEVATGEQVYPVHVLAAGTAMGVFLVAAAGLALTTTSRRWAWATAVALVPASLAWRWEDESRAWSWVGVGVAVVLARALLVRGTPAQRRARGRRSWLAVVVPAAGWLAVCLPSAVLTVRDVLTGDVPLTVHHVEDQSMLGWTLLGMLMTGATAGLLREAARRPAKVPDAAGLR